MRVFQIWTREQFSFSRDGVVFHGCVFGGSNESIEAARLDAHRRWEGVCRRISGKGDRRPEGYEADIREEWLRSVNAGAVVTRNRYGAQILNCTDAVFVDIDRAPFRFTDLFAPSRDADRTRERIAAHLRKIVAGRRHGIGGARLYDTPRGIRAVVRCPTADPHSDEVRAMMRGVGADRIYAMLCRRQGCYRARLTAKPHRIGLKSLRQSWPVEIADAERRAEWVATYEAKCRKFAACRFRETLGDPPDSPVIALHDQLSGALSGRPIA